MKKKNALQTFLKKVERTRAFVKDKHDEARDQLIGFSGCDQSTGNTKARDLPSAEYASQLRRTLEFLTEKEREIDSIKAAIQAIRQLPARSADDREKTDASGNVKGDEKKTAQKTAEAMKKLSTQLAEVSSQVTRCLAKDRKKLKLVKLACGVQGPQGTARAQDSETQSQSPDWPLVTTAQSSSEIPASSNNFSCGASTMEMARELDSTDSENISLKNASERIPLGTVMTASGAQEQDAVRSGSPSKTPGHTLRGNSTSLEVTDENGLAVNDSPPPVSPMSPEESLQTTVVTPQSSGMAFLSRETFHKLSSLIDFGQPRNNPELTPLTPPGEVEAASGIAQRGTPTAIQPTIITPPLQTTSASEPLSPPPTPQDITSPWKVKAFLDQTLKCAKGTAKDAGRTDVLKSPNQTMRVILVKSSDIVGYGGPGIFDQTRSWTSIQLDRDMIMDRVAEYIRTYLGLVNRGLMRLWVFERSSEGHFLPRSILKGKTMRSRLSTFGRSMVALFVQFAEDSRRLYTFNHQHERLVFIKSRDIDSGQAVVYGHHVVNTSMCTRRVVEILQEKFLGSASIATSLQCYVESSPGETESVQTGSTSTFKADLGHFCQHGVILWLAEDGSDAKTTSRLTADGVQYYKSLKVNISTVPEEIGAYNNAIISEGCHKQVTAYKNSVNANDDCSRQLAACSSSTCRDASHEHLGAGNSSIDSGDISHHVAAYDRFVNAGASPAFRGTAVEADTWSPGPSSASFSHLDLTHLYFQRASLSDSSNSVVVHSALRQPQFIVPLNPSVTPTAVPVAGFQQGHVTQFGHVNNSDSPALGKDLVYETVGSVQHHVSNGRDSNSKTIPSCCKAVPKSSGCDDGKVKEKSCQAEKVPLDVVTHKKPGDMEDRRTLSDVSGSKILLETPGGRHNESSVKMMPKDMGKPANQTPDPAATSPTSSRNSMPTTASCAPLNVNALEFIPGSKLEARDNTLLGCSPSEINESSSFSATTSTYVQKPSRDFDSLTSEENRPELDSTMKPKQGLAAPILGSAENESEYAKDTRHEQWTASLNAEVMKASDAEKVRSNTNPPETPPNCHRHSQIFGKGTAFKCKNKVQHSTDEIRSELKDRSTCRVSQGRAFSLPPRPRGPDNQQRTARQNVFRPQRNRYSSWTESCHQTTADRFRPFPQHANRCFTPSALAQNLNFSFPRSSCLPQGRQGCSDSNQPCGQKWNRSRQSWKGDMFFQRKTTFHEPRIHNVRPSLEPVCTRNFVDAKREAASEASSARCGQSSAEDCPQITQSKPDKVVVFDGNRPETDVYVGDRSGKADLSEHVTPKTVIPATDATKKPAFIARPVGMRPCRAFCRYDRIFQLPRFANSAELHAYVSPTRRFIQLGCSRNDVRQPNLGRAVATECSQERLCLGQRPSHVFPNAGHSRNSFISSPVGGSAILSRHLSAAEASENSPPREAAAPVAQADLPRVRKGFIRYVSPSVQNIPKSPTL